MGTEILRPQDLLVERFRVSPPPPAYLRRKNFPANGKLTNLIVNRRPSYHAGSKRTSPGPVKKKFNENRKTSPGAAPRKEDSDPIMGKVTLLRRGESFDSLTAKTSNGGNPKAKFPNRKPVDDLAVCGTARIGPQSLEMEPKQIQLPPSDIYAGSACTLSPSPRSVPLPSFFNKKQQNETVDDSATRDLRRLLRLD